MQKVIRKSISIILIVLMLFANVPLYGSLGENQSFFDLFNTKATANSTTPEDWTLGGTCSYDSTTGIYTLLPDQYWASGTMQLNESVTADFSISFDYYTGNRSGGTCSRSGGDGFAVFFFCKTLSMGAYWMPKTGYSVEIDTYCNDGFEKHIHGNHVAINTSTTKHVVDAPIVEAEDDDWHNLRITVISGKCSVFIDGTERISYDTPPNEYGTLAISANTGAARNMHAIKNIKVNTGISNDTETDSKFGWSILNTKDSFGYDAKHRLSVIDYYSVNEYNLYTLAKTSAGTAWEGSCFGLSLLALADYNGQIDLSKYFSNIGSCLNEYGYQKIDEIVTKSGVSGKAYVLTGNDEIIKIIEKAQMSQFSDDIEKTEVFGIGSDISDFVEYCKSGNSPLLVTMKPAEHAVAVDPTRPVEQDKDGKYKIWLYDSNSPRISNKIDGQIELYNNQQSYLLVDTENNKWSYCYNGNEGSWYSHYSIDAYEGDSFKGWKTIRFFDISKLSQDFFTYELKMKKNAAIIRMTEDSSIEIKSFAETLFEFDYARYQIADKTYSYMPYYQENNDEDTIKSELGCLTLPAGNYTFTTDGEVSFLRFIEDDYIVSLSSDDDIIVDFDDENKNITIKNAGDKEVSFEFGVENIQNSSADVVKGKIEPEKEIYIDFSGSESDSASVITTTGRLDSITTSYIQNNEETDSHYHKCAYADSGHLKSDWITESAASCTQAGTKYTECTVCYERLSTEKIPATGHTDNNNDNNCDNCGEKIKQEVDTNCNHICHTDNEFLKFIWTIFNFLMRLFSMERICTCGAAHY